MKLTLAILILATSQTLAADCTDPLDPACQSTNNSGTNSWPLNYPPGSLQVRIDQSQIHVTNTIANHVYQIRQSTNCLEWSLLNLPWTNAVGAEKSFSYSSTNEQRAYRVQDISFFSVEEEVVHQTNNIYSCGGFYVGIAHYYRDLNWGYPYNPTTSVHRVIDPSGNHWIEAEGRYGDILCGFGQLTVTNQSSGHPFSAEYRFSLMFHSNAPSDYTLIYEGWIP